MKVTILGCGSSAGVPMIGCDCSVCTSDNPKNHRTRASIVIEEQGVNVLVDISPDFRQQMLSNKIEHLDAVLITHAHADHVHGIDDIRPYNFIADNPLPLYADRATIDELQERFAYAFQPPIREYGWFRPALEPIEISQPKNQPIKIKDKIDLSCFYQNHGSYNSLGVRVGGFVYSTDVKSFPKDSEEMLHDIDVWVVDCLRREPAPTHAHLDLTLEWIERYKPNKAILTHMNHSLDYDELRAELPSHVDVAYDGMVLEL